MPILTTTLGWSLAIYVLKSSRSLGMQSQVKELLLYVRSQLKNLPTAYENGDPLTSGKKLRDLGVP